MLYYELKNCIESMLDINENYQYISKMGSK